MYDAADRTLTVANAGGYSTTAIRCIGAEPLYVDIDPMVQLHSVRLLRGDETVKITALGRVNWVSYILIEPDHAIRNPF